ncbi:hypothetical protein [Sphingobium sp. YR768]|uniref:hypothetical protein n=1 Tax=Sphingobium sp. YR768 TaxID=1884365 RepID=UPI0008C169E7|nr:hypothetical protein [Sphingobium sp. YR768]SEQ47674.1 hypothetical protein SAMN05518866_10157 [Sphingobium sp. YR768]
MTDAQQGTSIMETAPVAFDPAAWLSAYVELGGGYTVTGASCCFHSPNSLSHVERTALAAHQLPLLADPAKREAVRAYLTVRSPKEALAC